MTRRDFTRYTYETVYQPGLMRLRDALQEWNKKANASSLPYEAEVERLTEIIEHGQRQLDSGARGITEVTSPVTDQFLRAAGLLSVYEKEREITECRARGYPQRVIQVMEQDLTRMREMANLIQGVEPAEVLWAVIPNPRAVEPILTEEAVEPGVTWDVFISHATEDKEPFVRSLAEALRATGLRIWYDRFTLKVGDHLRRSIDQGLSRSRFGVVILSPYFFAKEWPQLELDGLAAREIAGKKVILPVWHNIDANEIRRFSPTLADRVAVKSSLGIERVVQELLDAISG